MARRASRVKPWLLMAVMAAAAIVPQPAASDTQDDGSLTASISYSPDPIHVGDIVNITILLTNTLNTSLNIDYVIYAGASNRIATGTMQILAGANVSLTAQWVPVQTDAGVPYFPLGIDVIDNSTGVYLLSEYQYVNIWSAGEGPLVAFVSIIPANIHVNDEATVMVWLNNNGYSKLYDVKYTIYTGPGDYLASGIIPELWPAGTCESKPGGGEELKAYWTPMATGSYKVGVNASNANGTASLVKTIDVAVSKEPPVSLKIMPSALIVKPGEAFNVEAAIAWPTWTLGPENPRSDNENTHITTPFNGREVSGVVNVTASVVHCRCLGFTKLYVDGVFINNGTRGPADVYEHFSHLWDSSTVAPGRHNITVIGKHDESRDTVFVDVKQSLFIENLPAGWTSAIAGHNLSFAVPLGSQTGDYSIIILVKNTTGRILAEATIPVLVANGTVPPGFSLTVTPASVSVQPGTSFNVAASVEYIMGTTQPVPTKNTQIVSPPAGGFVNGNVTIEVWVQTCNCTGLTDLYIDGAFHSNGTPLRTPAELNGTYFEVFEHHWDSSAASSGWHNLTVLGKHKEYFDTVFVCVNSTCDLWVSSIPPGWTHDPSSINFTPVENVPMKATMTFTVPADAQNGTYSIVLLVTGPLDKILAEAVVTVVVVNGTAPVPVADLAIVPVDVVIWPDMAIAGTDITVRLTASNLGDATGIGDISVSIDERNLLYKDNATIGPGGTMDLSVVWTSTAGTHALEVKVRTRSGGNRDAGNDLASKTFTILPIPPSPRLLLSLGNDTVRLAPGGLVAVDVWVDCRDNNAGGIILKATLSEGFPVLVEIVSPPPLALDKGESWKSRLVLRATSSPGDTPRSGTVAVSVTGDGAYGARHNISVHILEPAPVRTESPMVAVGAAAAVSVVVVAAVAIGATEIGFVALMSLLLPLYSKIRKEEVLDQFTRGKIQGYITAYPGEHYNSIKAQLGINNGALAYHLKVLEREGYVTSIRDGVYKRYYPKETVIPRRRGQFSQMQEMVLGHIRESPGISQDGLARAMKVSNQVVYYHIRNLMAAGAVRLEKDGKETHCYLSEKIGTGFQGPGAG